MDTITLTTPDDWHLHLRDGVRLSAVVAHSVRQFGRALVMPNLKPPVATVAQALAYRQRILAALPAGSGFQPLMSLYLTDATTPNEIHRAAEAPEVLGFKLYPAGATTHSEAGPSSFDTSGGSGQARGLEAIYPLLEAMEKHDVVLQIHGEVTDPSVDIFDREKVFIYRHLAPIVRRFPALRLVLEHITTRDGVDFVKTGGDNLAGTLTAHHLLYNRNAMLVGGIRPHYYCLPVLKREQHRQALLEAATSGNPKFFLGTDSAPHPESAKESACGCAGCYTACVALELYAEAFDSVGHLHKLKAFASQHGADFYGLPRNTGSVSLRRESWTVPNSYAFGNSALVPLCAGETLAWRLLDLN